MKLSYREFIRWARRYKMCVRPLSYAPFPPVYYAQAKSREDGEPICVLWLDQATERWFTLAPSEIPEEVEALFA